MPPPTALTPRAKLLLPIFLVVLVVLSVHRLTCADLAAPHEFAGPTMGTTWTVKLVAPSLGRQDRARIAEAIEVQLQRVNALMSTYDPESELSRFNRHGSGEPFPVSRETLEVFRIARAVSELSDGAFDVTVGPLVEAWGFGETGRVPSPPSQSELGELRERIGYRRVTIELDAARLRKAHPETVCDLSAIAKGYAVDRVAEALGALGYTDFLVEVGGELRASGRRPDGDPWRVAIEAPDPAARRANAVVELRDLAMATSGDYRNFYESEGRWISHLIDPRTGRPIDHGLASVTVLHRDAVWADALATALVVLGPEEGWRVAEREGLAAHFIVRRPDGGFDARETPVFASLAGAQPRRRLASGPG